MGTLVSTVVRAETHHLIQGLTEGIRNQSTQWGERMEKKKGG